MKRSTVGIIKQFYAGMSAALTLFIAGTWLGWMSPAVRHFHDGSAPLEVGPSQVSWVVALMDAGNIVSSVPSGYLADALGRKTTLLLTAFLYLATWLITIWASSAEYLYVARIGAGVGKGVAFTVVPMYLGEIAGVRVRGAISTMFTGLLYAGGLFEYTIGPFVSYLALNCVSAAWPVVFFLTFVFLPDSPYYLLMKNKRKEAKRALAWFRHAAEDEGALVEELEQMTATVERDMREKGSFRDLVSSPGSRRALSIVLFLSAFQRFGGISPMLAYTVITLPPNGGYFAPDLYMIVFAVVMFVGNYVCTPLLDIVGRKPLLIFSCASCALCTAVSAAFYWTAGPENDLPGYNWLPYASLVVYGVAYSFGIGVIPSTYVGELFPTNVKSYASGVASIVFAVASFAINKVYLWVKVMYGVHFMFVFFTLCSATSVLFTATMVFETKGKTFAQIQDEFRRRTGAGKSSTKNAIIAANDPL